MLTSPAVCTSCDDGGSECVASTDRGRVRILRDDSDPADKPAPLVEACSVSPTAGPTASSCTRSTLLLAVAGCDVCLPATRLISPPPPRALSPCLLVCVCVLPTPVPVLRRVRGVMEVRAQSYYVALSCICVPPLSSQLRDAACRPAPTPKPLCCSLDCRVGLAALAAEGRHAVGVCVCVILTSGGGLRVCPSLQSGERIKRPVSKTLFAPCVPYPTRPPSARCAWARDVCYHKRPLSCSAPAVPPSCCDLPGFDSGVKSRYDTRISKLWHSQILCGSPPYDLARFLTHQTRWIQVPVDAGNVLPDPRRWFPVPHPPNVSALSPGLSQTLAVPHARLLQ